MIKAQTMPAQLVSKRAARSRFIIVGRVGVHMSVCFFSVDCLIGAQSRRATYLVAGYSLRVPSHAARESYRQHLLGSLHRKGFSLDLLDNSSY